MNSKEALARIYDYHSEPVFDSDGTTFENMFEKECYAIQKDLDRLEQLEIANKNNEGLVRDNVKLINRNLALGKENQDIKDDNTRLWHSIEYANNEIAKLKKAIEILKEVCSLNSNRILETERNLLKLSKEEYELLKEVLYDD